MLEPISDELGMSTKRILDHRNIDGRVFLDVARRHKKRFEGSVTTVREISWNANHGVGHHPW